MELTESRSLEARDGDESILEYDNGDCLGDSRRVHALN